MKQLKMPKDGKSCRVYSSKFREAGILPSDRASSMTTSAHSAIDVPNRLKHPVRPFFPAMAVLTIAMAAFAFVPEYVEHAEGRFPIAWVLHIHGAIMTAWLGSFLVQAFLGGTGRVSQHRRIGNFGFAIGWLAWASMIFVEWRSYAVKPPPEDVRAYDWLLPGPCVYLTFAFFLTWSYRNRKRPEWHKRLLLFALFLSATAAVERFSLDPVAFRILGLRHLWTGACCCH